MSDQTVYGESRMAKEKSERLNRRELIALRGLRLPKVTLQALNESGIFCVPSISVEYQRSANQYVIRAQESGGAVADIGAYCGFLSDGGEPLSWLQRIDSLGVNGIHARTVVNTLTRIHVVRVLHTYDVLITKHALVSDGGRKPTLENSILFYGRQGTLEFDLWGKDKEFAGSVLPLFFDRGGEALRVPMSLEAGLRLVVAGVSCCGCRHVHVLAPPAAEAAQIA